MPIATNSIEQWRGQICRHVLAIDFESTSDGLFHGSLAPLLDVRGVRLSKIGHTPGYALRDQHRARDGTNTIALLLASGGAMHVSQGGRETLLGTGQATLLRNFEPWRVALGRQVNYIAMLIPCEAFELMNAVDTLVGKRLPSSAALNLLRSYVSSLYAANDRPDNELARIASAHLTELMRLAVTEGAQRAEEAEFENIRDARLRVAVDMIARRHCEPDLSEEQIAAAQGISARYLQKLFERRGITFSGYVNELRLNTAFAALCKPEAKSRKVTDVALSCGFHDLSYFNRLFRRRFGDTPSNVRDGHEPL